MKHRFRIQLLGFIILIFHFSGYAQMTTNFDLFKDNIESSLPALETLIDSAIVHNPFVKFREIDIEVNEHKLQTDRVQWTKDLGLQTDIRYGTFDNFSTNTAEGQSPSLLATRSNQLNYGFGAFLKVPIYDLINRKNLINQSKAEVAKAESMADVQRKEVRQLVIRGYNDLVLKQRLLKNKYKYIETARINMLMAEKEFQNGIIPTGEYTRISEIASRAEADLEVSKVDFITAYMILEELAGYKFGLSNSVNISNESN